MSETLGESLLDHYERYLGVPRERRTFDSGQLNRTLQVLSYDGVFNRCRVFASLGLSHFEQALGGIFEIVVPVEEGWDEVPLIMANALFRLVQLRTRIDVGVRVSGVEAIDANFVRRYAKDSLYFTSPYGFPQEFAEIERGPQHGRILLGVFLSRPESELLDRIGSSAFEQLLEDKKVDPYSLARRCIAL